MIKSGRSRSFHLIRLLILSPTVRQSGIVHPLFTFLRMHHKVIRQINGRYGNLRIGLFFEVFKTQATKAIITNFAVIQLAKFIAKAAIITNLIFQDAFFHNSPHSYEHLFAKIKLRAILSIETDIRRVPVKKLDHPQEQIYEYIVSFSNEHGYPPSVREICAAVGLKSTSTVHTHLKNMEAKGMLTRDSAKQRALNLPEKSAEREDAIPLVGRVAAGLPILAVENVEDSFPLPDLLLKGSQPSEVFMLRVQGDSMINIGICPNDIIVVNSELAWDDGDVVVARIKEEESATVKRIYREKDCIRLQPENDFYEPILVPYSNVEIEGKVIGLLRPF